MPKGATGPTDFWDPLLWSERTRAGGGATEWHCSYDILRPYVLPAVSGKPRASALVVGCGTSMFPELVYDSGVHDVVVVDASHEVVDAIRARNEKGRSGLKAVMLDVGSLAGPGPSSEAAAEAVPSDSTLAGSRPRLSASQLGYRGGGPELCAALNGHALFDLVVEKGTIDCLLSRPGGWDRAASAIKAIHAAMRTPGVFVMVTHSPPEDRRELLELVYWHQVKAKVVRVTEPDELPSAPYQEEIRTVILSWGQPPQLQHQSSTAGQQGVGDSRRLRAMDSKFSFGSFAVSSATSSRSRDPSTSAAAESAVGSSEDFSFGTAPTTAPQRTLQGGGTSSAAASMSARQSAAGTAPSRLRPSAIVGQPGVAAAVTDDEIEAAARQRMEELENMAIDQEAGEPIHEAEADFRGSQAYIYICTK